MLVEKNDEITFCGVLFCTVSILTVSTRFVTEVHFVLCVNLKALNWPSDFILSDSCQYTALVWGGGVIAMTPTGNLL